MGADERRKAITKLEIRAEMRSNPDEEEDSTVIEQRAVERSKTQSVPAPARGIGYVLDKISPGQRGAVLVVITLAIIAALYGSGVVGAMLKRIGIG